MSPGANNTPVAVRIAHRHDALATAATDPQRDLDDARHDDDAVRPLQQPGRDGLFRQVGKGLEHALRVGQALVGARVRKGVAGRDEHDGEKQREAQGGKSVRVARKHVHQCVQGKGIRL